MSKKKQYKKHYDIQFPRGWWWGILSILFMISNINGNNIPNVVIAFTLIIFILSGLVKTIYVA